MTNSLRLAFRVYFRDYKLAFPYLLLLFFTGFLTYQIGKNLSANNTIRLLYLSDNLRVSALGFLFFSFLAYEFSSRLRRENGEEVIAVEDGARLKLIGAQGLTLLTMLIGWVAVILIPQVYYFSYHNILLPAYLSHILLSVFLYSFCPGLLAILFGVLIASKERPIAYVLIALLSLLSSPIPLQLFSGIRLGTVSLLYLLDLFQWNIPNSTYYPDAVYGIPLEHSRWFLVLFWITFIIFLVLWKNRSNQGWVKSLPLAFLLISCLSLGRFMLRTNDSILQKDERPDGILLGEFNYRRSTEPQVGTTAEFGVLSYDLIFSFENNMQADAKIELEQNDLDHYEFTLHHGYEVDRVQDEYKNDLKFERRGDLLRIFAVESTRFLSIHYEGNAGKYYSNRQAVALPGYLAFYPMPGHRLLWDYDADSYKVNDDFKPSDFKVKVNSSKTVLSNLPSQDHNTFAGRAGTISLYAGFMQEEVVNGQRYFYSPLSGQSLRIDPAAVREEWERLSTRLGIGSEFSLDNKIIIFQPMTIALDTVTEKFVDLSDHVLVLDLDPSATSIVYQHIMDQIPVSDETSTLRQVFQQNMGADSTYEVEKPSYEELKIILLAGNDESLNDLDLWKQYGDAINIGYSDLYMYQMNRLGLDHVMREVYQYLTAESRSVNQLDFLYNLGNRQND